MIMGNKRVVILFFWLLLGCKTTHWVNLPHESGNLVITRATGHTFIHTSYLNTEKYGKVPCNGMIVMDHNEAIIFDTPTDRVASAELIDWIQNQNGFKIKAVIATHFHEDCLGGLDTFHTHHIPSYALNRTIDLAKKEAIALPQNGFESRLELKVGRKKVIGAFWGPGHTEDNIIGYFPSEKVMFGGCLIKTQGAGKGNLNDANVSEWSNTVLKLKDEYQQTEIVIPGHGKTGGIELFDYTMALFKE
ncbi:MAG: subclass B1 metallo-beta-lactamase [Maribacter sp.]|uniref:subclass B1 metallo-beta-lactamase n=1 Tax=Maribacter sp. TaxID=1897614 RepID=UPI003C716802